MQPALIPAIAQATATVRVPRPPASKASKIFFGVMRLSLSNKLTRMARMIAIDALVCKVFVLVLTSQTRTTRGASR